MKPSLHSFLKAADLVEPVTTVPAALCLQQLLYTGDFSRQEDRHLMAAEIPNIKPDILIIVSFAKLFLSISDELWIGVRLN